MAYDRARELGSKGRSLAFYRLFQADLVLDLGLYEEAADLVDAALDLAPDWSQGHASQGRVLSAMGQYGSAVNSYTSALELQPDDPEWLAARADLLAASGDPTAAAGDLARAIEILSAEDPVIYGRSLSRLYSDHNIEPGDALRLAEADLARRQDVLGYDTYAWALYRNGRHAEALDAIQPVIASGLHDADAQLHAGLILVAAGDLQAATSHLEWVMTINPGFHPSSRRKPTRQSQDQTGDDRDRLCDRKDLRVPSPSHPGSRCYTQQRSQTCDGDGRLDSR